MRTGPVEEPRPPVVVGVDGSDSARHAAQWAADVASAWGAPVHLVHAVPDGIGDGASEPSWLRELHDAVERAGVEKAESLVVAATVTDALTARSRGAGLVVVGSYGEGARSGMLAGSAALALVEASECPVAVVRGAAPGLAPPRRGPVVVGTDAATDDVLHLGAAIAVGLGTRLSVLHAWSDIVEDAQGVHRTTSSGTELAALAVARLDTCLRPLTETHPDLPIERHVVDDTALRALLEHASGARLVVVGHRRDPGSGRRLGSTSRGLVAFAPCPVVVTAHRRA
jgi:nucleotide-binding universal stress UspA family protein